MTTSFVAPSVEVAKDLVSFLSRARRINDSSARLIADDGVLQVYVGVLFPRGLLDRTPTVLGLRVVPLQEPASFDLIVPLESLVFRLERAIEAQEYADGPLSVVTPSPSPSLSWASVTPPRDGWHRRISINSEVLAEAAKAGVDQVARALPENSGEAVVQKVRAEVWGQPLTKKKGIPWAAGFAADALGFLGGKSLGVHTVDNWVRLTSKDGYVLVKTFDTPEGLDD